MQSGAGWESWRVPVVDTLRQSQSQRHTNAAHHDKFSSSRFVASIFKMGWNFKTLNLLPRFVVHPILTET